MHCRANSENVELLRCVEAALSHRAGTSPRLRKGMGSQRKSCVEKRLPMSDEPDGSRHQWVVFRRVSKFVWVLGKKPQSFRRVVVRQRSGGKRGPLPGQFTRR